MVARIVFLFLAVITTIYSSNSYARVLTSYSIGDGVYNLVLFDEKEGKEHLSKFNDILREADVGLQIQTCRLIIDLPVGTGQGNHSYGGICNTSQPENNRIVHICYDLIVGQSHYEMFEDANFLHSQKLLTLNSLVNFVHKNCYGG